MKKIFIFIVLLLALTATPARAADLNIDCPSSPNDCTKSGIDPLFDTATDGNWYPGKSIIKTINLKNSGGVEREMALKASRKDVSPSPLEDVLTVDIRQTGSSDIIYNNSLKEFYRQDSISFGNFPNTAARDYNFTITMDINAGNQYQEINASFDLTLGSWENSSGPTSTPGSSSSSTPTPTGTQTNILNFINNTQTVINTGETPTPTPVPGQVLGTLENPINQGFGGMSLFCRDNSIWPLMFLGQLVMTFFYFLLSRKNFQRLAYLGLSLLTISAIVISWEFFCNPSLAILSLTIGLGGILVTYGKLEINRQGDIFSLTA